MNFTQFLADILGGINSVLGNYGWSIMVFTLLIRLVLMPFDYKSRVSMRRMSDLQPQIAVLQKKYAKDQAKLNQKTSELYKKERINPLSGCLPLLLSYPILIAMFTAMRSFANQQVVKQILEILQIMWCCKSYHIRNICTLITDTFQIGDHFQCCRDKTEIRSDRLLL